MQRRAHTPIPVPACSSEEHTWVADNDGMRSRRQMARASGTYRSCIPARIADLSLLLPTSVAADLAEAEAALARFSTFAATALGSSGSPLGPFSAVLLRTEASSSSHIENLTVGARQLALAQLDLATSSNATLVMNNVRAMQRALDMHTTMGVEALLDMHRALLHPDPNAGTLRDELVWVGTSPVSPVGAAHVAPQPELVHAALEDLFDFMARADWPLVAHAAVAHAQFETIHPFTDGNGRTGRALIHHMLARAGLGAITAPISAGFLRDTGAYFDALTAFREGDAGPIVDVFVGASLFAAGAGERLVTDISAWKDEAARHARVTGAPPVAHRLLDVLVSHPALTSKAAADQLGIHVNTAIRALGALEEASVVREATGARRSRAWVATDLVTLLDSFAGDFRRT